MLVFNWEFDYNFWSRFDKNAYNTGIGALVGLAYFDNNTIENCTSVGYSIEYNTSRKPKGIVIKV